MIQENKMGKVILLLMTSLQISAGSQAADLPKSVVFKESLCSAAQRLGRLAGKQVYCPTDLKGTVDFTFADETPTEAKFDKLLKALLDDEGWAVGDVGIPGFYMIKRQRDIKDSKLPLYTDPAQIPDDVGYCTVTIKLTHIPADEASRVFRNFMPPNTRIISYDQTNAVIITGRGTDLRNLAQMITFLDLPDTRSPALKAAISVHNKQLKPAK